MQGMWMMHNETISYNAAFWQLQCKKTLYVHNNYHLLIFLSFKPRCPSCVQCNSANKPNSHV